MKKQVILCVDDEMLVLTSLRDQLMRNFGSLYRIELAESGEEALEVMEEIEKDGYEMAIIITDQIMPGIKGDELLTAAHKRYPKSLKIFLTGQADAQAVGSAVNKANLYRYIPKPWDENDLQVTVSTALRSYNQDKQLAEQNRLLENLYQIAQQEIEERKRVEALLAKTNQNLEKKVSERTKELSKTLENLKNTQDQLIVQEKLASLGRLSAGIAHEIKNPLNFINSFAALNLDRTSELKEFIDTGKIPLSSKTGEEIREILADLVSNAENILEEGQRVDRIIRSMLIHVRDCSTKPQNHNINELLKEVVNLAHHAMRSKDFFFNVTMDTIFDSQVPNSMILVQALNQVFVNLINNACYAMVEKKRTLGDNYMPRLNVSTYNSPEHIEIRFRDNGTGISEKSIGKIFDPFFTTKPAGEGAGLGLSICHDIICQGHGGDIQAISKEGQYTEMVIKIPKNNL
jgi:signal transduction histidine kinase